MKTFLTMEDVARHLGLSRVTVSRVINGHDNVSEDTRRRVHDYIRETGYFPHFATRVLPAGRTKTIGIVCSHAFNILPSHILTTVLNEVARHEMEAEMLLAKDASSEKAAIISLTKKTVDGLIVFSNFCDNDFLEGITWDQKNIVFNGPGPKNGLTVQTDPYRGMKQLLTYLIDRGHRHIHYMGAPREMSRVGHDERQKGYLASMKDAGLKSSTSFAKEVDSISGYREAKNILLSQSPHPTALMCYNDELAFGAIRAATDLGISVPHQLSVTGYDGIDLLRFAKPSLTTYRIDPVAVGKALVRMLMKQLASQENLRGDNWVEGELIVGESVAAVSLVNIPSA